MLYFSLILHSFERKINALPDLVLYFKKLKIVGINFYNNYFEFVLFFNLNYDKSKIKKKINIPLFSLKKSSNKL